MSTLIETRTGTSSEEVRALRDRFVPKGLHVGTPVVVARASGAEVWDPEGKRYLDFVAGIGALNLGHQHPAVLAAVRAQLDRYAHVSAQTVTYEPYVRLAEALDRIFPRAAGSVVATKSVFANSGAEAVENAMKIARVATGREWIIAFQNSFHGRTYAAMTATGKTKNSRMAFMRTTSPNIAHLPYPYPYRPIADLTEEELAELHVRLFEQALETNLAPEHVAAVIIEPIQGEGGFVVPPDGFLPGLAEFCRAHGIVLIADEIQSGFCRTGDWFACDHEGVVPDLVTTAKGIAGGLPLAGVTGRAELMDAVHPGGLGGTYGGNPVACAAALGAIATMEAGNLAGRARRIGEIMLPRLHALAEKYPVIGDVRGRGAMLAIELVEPGGLRPAPAAAGKVAAACHSAGLMVLTCGTFGNVLRFLPPLVIPEHLLDEGLTILEEAFARL